MTATEPTENVGDVPVVTKKLVGHVDNSAYPQITVDIQLTLTTPAKAAGPVPVIMELRVRPAAAAGATPAAPPPGAGGPTLAAAGAREGLGLRDPRPEQHPGRQRRRADARDHRPGQQGPAAQARRLGRAARPGPGARAARSTTSRPTRPWTRSRSGIEGLSRYGKAALVAMAYDPRFAIGFIGSSGAGGAKLHRRNFGELVENVAGSGEYHWMAGNYPQVRRPAHAERPAGGLPTSWSRCARRGRCSSASGRSRWKARLGGRQGDVPGRRRRRPGVPAARQEGPRAPTEFPPMETALVDGEIAFRQHGGGHTTGPNWPTFLTFATATSRAPRSAPQPNSLARPRGLARRVENLGDDQVVVERRQPVRRRLPRTTAGRVQLDHVRQPAVRGSGVSACSASFGSAPASAVAASRNRWPWSP